MFPATMLLHSVDRDPSEKNVGAVLGSRRSVGAMHFQLVDMLTSTPYRGNSLSVFPGAGGLSASQIARITGTSNHTESVPLFADACSSCSPPTRRWSARSDSEMLTRNGSYGVGDNNVG